MPDDTAVASSPALLLDLTAQIVSAQAGHGDVDAATLPELIRSVHQALSGIGQPAAAVEPPRPEPAVPIKRSVRHDRITCLECGRSMSLLKRHLQTDHGLTPAEYRARWGLPESYPMVAPDYAATRSSLAKQSRLGQKRGSGVAGRPEMAKTEEAKPPPPAKGRGRRKAASK